MPTPEEVLANAQSREQIRASLKQMKGHMAKVLPVMAAIGIYSGLTKLRLNRSPHSSEGRLYNSLAESIANENGLTVTQGIPEKALIFNKSPYYNVDDKEINMRGNKLPGVLAHEYGHHLNHQTNNPIYKVRRYQPTVMAAGALGTGVGAFLKNMVEKERIMNKRAISIIKSPRTAAAVASLIPLAFVPAIVDEIQASRKGYKKLKEFGPTRPQKIEAGKDMAWGLGSYLMPLVTMGAGKIDFGV